MWIILMELFLKFFQSEKHEKNDCWFKKDVGSLKAMTTKIKILQLYYLFVKTIRL